MNTSYLLSRDFLYTTFSKIKAKNTEGIFNSNEYNRLNLLILINSGKVLPKYKIEDFYKINPNGNWNIENLSSNLSLTTKFVLENPNGLMINGELKDWHWVELSNNIELNKEVIDTFLTLYKRRKLIYHPFDRDHSYYVMYGDLQFSSNKTTTDKLVEYISESLHENILDFKELSRSKNISLGFIINKYDNSDYRWSLRNICLHPNITDDFINNFILSKSEKIISVSKYYTNKEPTRDVLFSQLLKNKNLSLKFIESNLDEFTDILIIDDFNTRELSRKFSKNIKFTDEFLIRTINDSKYKNIYDFDSLMENKNINHETLVSIFNNVDNITELNLNLGPDYHPKYFIKTLPLNLIRISNLFSDENNYSIRDNWGPLSGNLNLTPKFIEEFINKNWNWDILSSHPNIKMDFIESTLDNNDYNWKFSSISGNPNLTKEFLFEHLDKTYDTIRTHNNEFRTRQYGRTARDRNQVDEWDASWSWVSLSVNEVMTINLIKYFMNTEYKNRLNFNIIITDNINVTIKFIILTYNDPNYNWGDISIRHDLTPDMLNGNYEIDYDHLSNNNLGWYEIYGESFFED